MKRLSLARWLLTTFMILTPAVARADNWPQWRGPNNDGISKESNLPVEWDASKNVLWKLPLPGMGGSTPTVWDDRLFLTCLDGANLVLMGISIDGKELWRSKLGSGNKVSRTDEGNWASASPSTDGKHVYAFVASGDIGCFDFDGKEVWKLNVQERYGKFDIQFGLHSTPVLHGDRLYLQLIHSGGAWVVALDKATGKEVWKVKRVSDGTDENEHSYASPFMWTRGKDAYLVTHGNDYTIAYRLDDGSELWRVVELNPKAKYNKYLRFVASPVATPDLIVIPSAKNGPVVALKPDAKGVVMPGSEHERWRKPSNTPDVPSPLVHDGLVYLCRENGPLICLEADSGKELYNQRIHSSRYRASPVYGDGKLYLTARDGTITVVKAGPTFEKLAENKMGDQISASPAISNGRIYLRGFTTLFAIGAAKK